MHPKNVATPAVAFTGLAVQVKTPLPGGLVLIAKVTADVSVVTVLPLASSTVTTGCVVQAVPPVHPAGAVVKANCVADPGVMLKPLLVAAV